MGSCASGCAPIKRIDSLDIILQEISNLEAQAQQSMNNSVLWNTSSHHLGAKNESSQKTEIQATSYQKQTDEQACDIIENDSHLQINFTYQSEKQIQFNNFQVRKNRFTEDREEEVKFIIWKNQIEERNRTRQISSDNNSYKSLSLKKSQAQLSSFNENLSESNLQVSNQALNSKLSQINSQLEQVVKKPKLEEDKKLDDEIGTFQILDKIGLHQSEIEQICQQQQQKPGALIITSINAQKPLPIFRYNQNSSSSIIKGSSNQFSQRVSSDSKKSAVNSSQNSSTMKQHAALEKVFSDLCYADRKFNQNESISSSVVHRKKGILKYKTKKVWEILRSNSAKNKQTPHSNRSSKSIYVNGRKKKVCFTPDTNFNFERQSDKNFQKENRKKGLFF